MGDVAKKKVSKSTKVGGGEVLLIERDRFANRQDVAVVSCTHTEMKGRMATTLIEKWGLVAGIPDGEDSAGRTTLRLLNPEEIVERACRTAHLAVERFRQLGWVHEIPEDLLIGAGAGPYEE